MQWYFMFPFNDVVGGLDQTQILIVNAPLLWRFEFRDDQLVARAMEIFCSHDFFLL